MCSLFAKSNNICIVAGGASFIPFEAKISDIKCAVLGTGLTSDMIAEDKQVGSSTTMIIFDNFYK